MCVSISFFTLDAGTRLFFTLCPPCLPRVGIQSPIRHTPLGRLQLGWCVRHEMMRWCEIFERPFDFSFFLLALLPSSFSPLLPPPPKPQPPNMIPFNFVRSAPYSLFFFLSDTTGCIFLLAAAADHVGTVGSFLVCFLGAV